MRPTSVEEWKDARAVCRPAPRAIITSSSIKKRLKPLFGSSGVIHKNLRSSFSSLNLCINIPPFISQGCSKLHIGLHPPCAGSLNVYGTVNAPVTFSDSSANAFECPISPRNTQAAGGGKMEFKITDSNRLNGISSHSSARVCNQSEASPAQQRKRSVRGARRGLFVSE